jgi:hypothetical protein
VVRSLLVILLAAAALLAGAAGVQASCVVPPPLREQVASAGLVFVGTVIFTSDNDRVARVRVESIWRGPELPTYVDVHGSPVLGPGAASSIDRKYSAGTRYLFVLYGADQPLQDNSCSGTQVYTAELATLAPAGARSPAPPTAGDEIHNAVALYWQPALGVLALMAAAGVIALRRAGRPR